MRAIRIITGSVFVLLGFGFQYIGVVIGGDDVDKNLDRAMKNWSKK